MVENSTSLVLMTGSPPGRKKQEVEEYFEHVCGLKVDRYFNPIISAPLGRGKLAAYNFVPKAIGPKGMLESIDYT